MPETAGRLGLLAEIMSVVPKERRKLTDVSAGDVLDPKGRVTVWSADDEKLVLRLTADR
jgi:hypothetical protein